MKPALLAILIALSACADDEPEPECTAATPYKGTMISCAEDTGICIAAGEEPACMPLCGPPGAFCADGELPATLVVTDDAGAVLPPVCYCEPAPTSHVRQPIIRDHR